jgi:cytoskeletal protein CcmA (bactofilin family)
MLFNKKIHEDLTEPLNSEPVKPDAVITAKARRPDGTATRSVIDPWLRITGNLEGEAELQIDGHIRGDIRCTKLVISKAASVEGNVTADEVVIRGRVTGIVRGNRVVLQEGANVQNEISYKHLCIEEGALFEGIVRMREKPLEELLAVAAEMRSSAKKAKVKTDEAKPSDDAQSDDEFPAKSQVNVLSEDEDESSAVATTPLAEPDMKRLRSQMRGNRPA